MGNARFSASDWSTRASSYHGQSTAQIFKQKAVAPDLDAKKITVRESVDSDANPLSTPIIVGVDETGSMGILADNIIRKGLGVIMTEVYERKPVTDPHLLCLAIGDAYTDRSPIQATQFEASVTPLADQVEKLYIEHNGGGNGGESYLIAHYFAAFKTKCDSMIKRKKKGYLFTIGDEAPHDKLTKEQIRQFFGDDVEKDMTAKDLLNLASQGFEVFHLIVKPAYDSAVPKWRELLGERAIMVDDYEKLSEVIVSTIQIIEGHDAKAVIDSWSGDTSVVVAGALKGLQKVGQAGVGPVNF